MKGKDLPSYIHRRKRDGVLLFRKRYGGRIVEVKLETQFPEGQPVPFALHQERERLLNDPLPVAPGKDLAAVVRHYYASAKYTKLSARTASDYDKHIPYFRDKMGHLQPRHIERHHVISWRDKWAKQRTSHFANYRHTVLKILMEHAKDMGLLTKEMENPAKGIRALEVESEEREPWPVEMVAKFRETYPNQSRERMLFELMLGTGQRIGDFLDMQWSHIAGDAISVKQNKTKKRLLIPATGELLEALAVHRSAWEHTRGSDKGLFILQKDMSKTKAPGKWAYRGAADAMRKARKSIGADRFDNHSLRYTAATELLRAGCTDDDIASVTGQSLEMVRHYTRSERQKIRARSAQQKRANFGVAPPREEK